MASKRIGDSTVVFENPPFIGSTASVVGPKEGKGPLKGWFDLIIDDDMFGEKTPEKAERRFLTEAVGLAMDKVSLEYDAINYFLAGDLLNQIISANFTARQINVPFIGMYGACSTSALSLATGSMLVDGGFADRVICATSSHYQCAERQYRYPIELNIQRKLTSQYTVTGAGASVVGNVGGFARVTHATIGRVIDLGITSADQMGPAMAPAAADTLLRHLKDTGRKPDYYDFIMTGDLGKLGAEIFVELSSRNGIALPDGKYNDGGIMIFEGYKTVGMGGSGCGCSASVLYGYIAKRMAMKELKKVLLLATGALLSPLTCLQGETIPCTATAVALEIA